MARCLQGLEASGCSLEARRLGVLEALRLGVSTVWSFLLLLSAPGRRLGAPWELLDAPWELCWVPCGCLGAPCGCLGAPCGCLGAACVTVCFLARPYKSHVMIFILLQDFDFCEMDR